MFSLDSPPRLFPSLPWFSDSFSPLFLLGGGVLSVLPVDLASGVVRTHPGPWCVSLWPKFKGGRGHKEKKKIPTGGNICEEASQNYYCHSASFLCGQEEEVRCGLKELVASCHSWGGCAKADHPEENSQEVVLPVMSKTRTWIFQVHVQ